MAEVELYGDVVLRLLSFHDIEDETRQGSLSDEVASIVPVPFLPNLSPYPSKRSKSTYSLSRIDQTVGNVPDLLAVQEYI